MIGHKTAIPSTSIWELFARNHRVQNNRNNSVCRWWSMTWSPYICFLLKRLDKFINVALFFLINILKMSTFNSNAVLFTSSLKVREEVKGASESPQESLTSQSTLHIQRASPWNTARKDETQMNWTKQHAPCHTPGMLFLSQPERSFRMSVFYQWLKKYWGVPLPQNGQLLHPSVHNFVENSRGSISKQPKRKTGQLRRCFVKDPYHAHDLGDVLCQARGPLRLLWQHVEEPEPSVFQGNPFSLEETPRVIC